ncbi:YqjF family protein [Streptomyces chryseus]
MRFTSLTPEPISANPPGAATKALLTQSWLDLAFLHWPVEPADVATLLPKGIVPDTFDGVTYVGLVAFRMHRVGWLGLPGLPYLGSFPETNVRLYSVDSEGRRGVVFRSLDAGRLIPVVTGRAFFHLPYLWSKMTIRHCEDTITYTSTRRWPGPRGAHSRIVIRPRERAERHTALEDFLTARWGMHYSIFGRSVYLPNTHQRWPLYRADLLEYDEDLIRSAGLTTPVSAPASVLYSPGVSVRFGSPLRAGSFHPPVSS